MELDEIITERYSVRSFSDEKVEPEKINEILKAAQLAPTAVNYQPQQIYALKSKEALEKINMLSPSIYNASTVFLICSNENETWKSSTEIGYTTGEMDASIVCTFMMLKAWDIGIGSLWVRLFDSYEVSRAFNLPDYIKPRCLLPIGYPTEDCKPYAPWHNVNKEINEFTKEI